MRAPILAIAVVWAVGAGCDGGDGPVEAPIRIEAGLDAVVLDASAPDVERLLDVAVDVAVDAAPDAVVDAAVDAAVDAGPPGPARVLDLGEHLPGELFNFAVPAGFDAMLITGRGAPAGLYAVVDVTGPGGSLVGATPTAGPLRTTFNPEVAVALLPNTGEAADALVAGDYTARVVSAGPDARPVQVEVWLTGGLGTSLRVNLLLPPATGRLPDEPAVTAMARALEGQLAAAFDLAAVEAVPALLDEMAPADLVLDSAAGDLSGLDELAAAATADYGDGLDVYLVDHISDGPNAQSGFSGGLPAPVGARGTAAAVLAVRTPLLDGFPDAVADLAVHELGHALGLYHTTEPRADRHDPIADTAECPLACDTDGDGIVFARECGARGRGEAPCLGADNLMFWTLGGLRDTTPGQRRVVRSHPAVAR
ncbi:MAG: hypothetical protein KC620_21035 [Myxococcales bacterium]|nr:hypothetical protein [Myxococcales bacterium]